MREEVEDVDDESGLRIGEVAGSDDEGTRVVEPVKDLFGGEGGLFLDHCWGRIVE